MLNPFHIHCLIKNSKVSLNELSRITWIKTTILKKIKEWHINNINSKVYIQFMKWYKDYLQVNIKSRKESNIYLFKHKQWLQPQDNQ